MESNGCLARTRTHSKTASIQGQNDQVATLCATKFSTDADLVEVAEAWPALPEPLRGAVLAIIRSASGRDPKRSAEPVPPEPQGLRGGVSPSREGKSAERVKGRTGVAGANGGGGRR
jgi:hypothetical protein